MIFIYSLSDPKTNKIRYIGKSANCRKRFNQHLRSIENNYSHKSNWIRSLLNEGLKPILEILDEVAIAEWEFWEEFWINQCKAWGFDLTNGTNGGDTGPSFKGHNHSTESKLLMSKNSKEYWKNKKHPLTGQKKSGSMVNMMRSRSRKVIQKDLMGNEIKVWDTLLQVTEKFGLHRTKFYAAIKQNIPVKGYFWEFISNEYFNNWNNSQPSKG